MTNILLLATIVFVAGIVRGYAGFGLSAIVVTAGSLFLPPAQLVPLAYLLEIGASVHMLRSVYRDVDRAMLGWLLLGCAVGVPIGQQLLLYLPADGTRLALSGLVLLATLALYSPYTLPYKLTEPVDRRFCLLVGLAAGLASGLAAVGGLVTMIALLGVDYDPVRARATLVVMFLALFGYGTLVSTLNGLTTLATVRTVLWLLPPLFLGVMVGQRQFLSTSTERFRRVVLGVLSVLAVVGVMRVVYNSGLGAQTIQERIRWS